MQLWSGWVDLISSSLQYLSTDVGLGAGLSIITITVALRLLILPITWSIAYRGQIRQRKLPLLQPELLQLKERHAHDRARALSLGGELGEAGRLARAAGRAYDESLDVCGA